ncbi:MAG: hypothetical protein AAGJ87_15695, partial [Pseudomonadota bacterium]
MLRFICGTSVYDDEANGRSESNCRVVTGSALIEPARSHRLEIPHHRVGGELRLESDLAVSLNTTRRPSIVGGRLRFYEGASTDTNDLEDQKSFQLQTTRGFVSRGYNQLHNSGRRGGDFAEIFLVTAEDTEDPAAAFFDQRTVLEENTADLRLHCEVEAAYAA